MKCHFCDETLKEGDIVYLMTGFVLRPFKKAETDGIVGTMLLAGALVKAFNVKPVIICQEENIEAVKNLSYVIGLHYHDNIKGIYEYPKSLAGKAGTTSNSLEMKSSSSISYLSFNIAKIFFLTASFSSPFKLLLPTKTSKSSPVTTREAVFFIWSFAR